MIRRFAPLLFVALVGCKAPAPPITATPPTKESIFTVVAQNKMQPTVRVANDTDAVMHLIMNDSEGNAHQLIVEPHSANSMDIPKGHYEAKVFDEAGKVRSSYGTADIADYKEYKAEFVVEMGGTYRFHIGD